MIGLLELGAEPHGGRAFHLESKSNTKLYYMIPLISFCPPPMDAWPPSFGIPSSAPDWN